MKVVDANVLLYAVNKDARHHAEARAWLDRAISGDDTVAFCWQVLLAFVRVATQPGLFPSPLGHTQAMDVVDMWLSAPAAVLVDPGVGHVRILRQLLADAGGASNLVNDAHIAALAVENKATVVSYDNDFDRFDGVRWTTPARLS